MNDNEKILALYLDKNRYPHELTKKSKFKVNKATDKYAFDRFGNKLTVFTRYEYKIDDNEVSVETFNNARDMLFENEMNAVEKDITERIKDMNKLYFDRDTIDKLNDTIDRIVPKEAKLVSTPRYPWGTKTDNTAKNKENNTMPKIIDYIFIPEHMVTIIKWSDGSETKVRGESENANQFCGFVSAIAKKAFGNGGKMLSEWDRLVIKPEEDKKKAEEKARIEAEEKVATEKLHAEAKAKRAAKKVKRNRKRTIEDMAKDFAVMYERDKMFDEAMKIAIDKYGVPAEFFETEHDCCCKDFNDTTEDCGENPCDMNEDNGEKE